MTPSLLSAHIQWLMEGRDYYGILPPDETAALMVAWRYHLQLIARD